MMNNKLILITPILLMLAGCSSNSNDSTDNGMNNEAAGPVMIIAVSGNMIDLTGTWETACRTDMTEGTDTDEEIVFDDDTETYNHYSYTSSDGSCTGTQSVDYGHAATVVADTSNSAITGWRNGMGDPAAAPTAADNSGPLSDTEAFTNLEFTLTSLNNISDVAVGDTVNFVYVVDDTGATPIIYRGDYDDPANKTGPYGGLADPFIQQ